MHCITVCQESIPNYLERDANSENSNPKTNGGTMMAIPSTSSDVSQEDNLPERNSSDQWMYEERTQCISLDLSLGSK